MTQLAGGQRISLSFSDRCKRAFLGRPMITDQLQHERLSNPVALGVLSPDAISSTAYGSEQVTKVTVLLPRREYSQILGRLLHDRTADMIAGVVSRIPDASAQIVAYDVATRIALATSAEGGSSAPSSGAHDRIELPEPERAHADGLTPQVVDSGGK
jgi:hypothetical protein